MTATIAPASRLTGALLAAAIGCAAGLEGVSAASARQSATEPVVSGRAVDDEGGVLAGAEARLLPLVDPYRRARIALGLEEPPTAIVSTTTDTKGLFRLRAPGAGAYQLELATSDLPSGGRVERRALLVVEGVELGSVQLRRAKPLQVSVRNAAGTPVAGARVGSAGPSARGLPIAAARSITDGTGLTSVLVEDNRVPRLIDVWVAAPGHAVTEAATRSDRLDLKLEPGVPRRLKVLGPDGKPAAASIATLAGIGIGVTGPDGTLDLRLGRDDLELDLLSPDLASARVILRGTVPASELASTATSGARESPSARTEVQEHVVRLEAATLVEATVVEKGDGRPVADVLVATTTTYDQVAKSDPAGAVALRLPARSQLLLEARSAQHAPAFWNAPDDRPQRVTVRLELERVRRLAGTVVDAASRGVAGAEVAFGGRSRGGRREAARTDEAGGFQLAMALENASTVLEVRHPDFAVVRHELTAAELEAARVRLVLDAGLTAVGWVADTAGLPLEGARVELAAFGSPNEAPWNQPPVDEHAGSDAEGRFVFAHVAPGRYSLRVEREGFAPAVVPGVEVLADDGESELGTITLGPGAAIEGVVLGADRVPLEGVELSVGGRQAPGRSATTDGEGRFALRDLTPGVDQLLRVSREGFVAAQRSVPVRLDAPPIEIVMQPGLRIEGVVVDGATGTEIPDARVSVEPQDRGSRFESPNSFRAVRSAVDGTFALEDLPPAVYRITVRATEYPPAAIESWDLRAGEEREPLRVELRRGAVVSGRVLDTEGEPLPLARVAARDEPRSGVFLRGRATIVDAEGRYRLDGLPAGAAVLEAHAREHTSRVREVVLEPGDNDIDFVLEPSPVIGGRVIDAQGQPVAGANVWTRSGNSGNGDTSEADGRFSIPAELGTILRVQASKPGVGASEIVVVEAASTPLPEIELLLRRGTTLRGRVEGLDVDELALTSVRASAPGTPGPPRSWARPDFEGRFQLEGLLPGHWTVSGVLPGRSVQEIVVVEPEVTEVEVTLRFDEGAALYGTVVSAAEPVVDARLSAQGLDVDTSAEARTDSTGAFRFEDLAPGRYRVRVDAPFRSMSHLQEVEVRGDQELTLELPGLALVGRVVSGESGPPLAGARLVLVPRDLASDELFLRMSGEHHTGAEGRFELTGLPGGSYTLEVSHQDHATRLVEVVVRDESPEEITIELERSSGITLRVLGPLGHPVRRASVSLRGAEGQLLLMRHYLAGEGGRIVAHDLPGGRHQILVTDGEGMAELEVEVPGDERAVQLQRGGFLEVSAPELSGEPGRFAVELERTTGPTRWWRENVTQLRAGFARLGPLPAGSWIVRVRDGDRELVGATVVEPGRSVAVELR